MLLIYLWNCVCAINSIDLTIIGFYKFLMANKIVQPLNELINLKRRKVDEMAFVDDTRAKKQVHIPIEMNH
jgi:hypothetical protein